METDLTLGGVLCTSEAVFITLADDAPVPLLDGAAGCQL